MNDFLKEVIEGLNSSPKTLPSKYFYDEQGDRLFQAIMRSPEYYLTNCEYEIFSLCKQEIASLFIRKLGDFDVIELGAGDCFKSRFLLKELVERNLPFTFFPVDISRNVIRQLRKTLPEEIPGLHMDGLNGEYISMLRRAQQLSQKPKVVLFLGSNIGNFKGSEATAFLQQIRSALNPGDLLFIGFDLVKDPRVTLAAYNDQGGFTSAFNLNLLKRINQELHADFDLTAFIHHPVYDPITKASRSYLISQRKQEVHIGTHTIRFNPFEPIYMEISQKYTLEDTRELARRGGFTPLHHFHDCKHWFTDAVWEVGT